MATIFNVHGYTTMRECLATIRQYVEVCAYKAVCAAASENNDPNDESWYPAFLDEERKIAADRIHALEIAETPEEKQAAKDMDQPIPCRGSGKKDQSKGKKHPIETDEKGFILNCSDLDMQAFMKIFFFRDAYRAKAIERFHIENEEVFKNTCTRLISYRNTEFAHLPVKASERELSDLTPEQEQKIITACNDSILLFFEFLRYFPKLGSDDESLSGQSYYNCAHNVWCKAKEQLRIQEVELETIIQKEKLQVDVQTLIGICEKCGITAVIPEGRKPYLITADYKKTVKPIRAMAQMLVQNKENLQSKADIEKELEKIRAAAQTNQSKIESELEKTRAAASNNRKHLGTVIALCILFIGILVALLIVLLGRGDNSETQDNVSPSQTQQLSVETSSSATQKLPADTSSEKQEYSGPAFISGSGTYAGLTFQVNQMKAAGILINYTNDGTSDYSLGWVGGAQVDVKTSVGTFTVSTDSGNQKILKNSSGAFSINLGQELMGQVQAIIVRDINPLSASGLPQGNSCSIEIPIQEGNPTSPGATASKIIRGETDYEGLKLTIDQKLSSGISVKYENSDTNAFSLGWVGNAKVQIKTDDANVEARVASSSLKIDKGTTGTFVIEVVGELSGTVEQIEIHNVNILTEVGLPSFTQKDLVIHIPITQSEE